MTHWLHTPAAQALGLTLFHFLWEGAALAAALALALAVLKSSRARYAAACLALAAMPLACSVTFERLLPQQTIPSAPLRPIISQEPLGSGSPAVRPGLQASDLLPYAVPIWLAGVLLLHARTLAGWAATRRLRRTGVCAAPAAWQQRLSQLAAGVRLSKPVALLESCRVDVPLVAGYLRPVILLPLDLLSGLPAGQVEAILLHELAHIRRRDYLVNLLQAVVENLLFYHPAVWWVSGVIRAEREHCCDDLAVAVKGDAFEYASALTALETRRGAAEPALAATGGNLMKRIRRLLNRPEPSHAAFTPAVAAGIVILTAAAALTAWQPKPQEQPPQQTDTKPLTQEDRVRREQKLRKELETPYAKWLTEDVAYIITNEERAAFKRLQTDQEREHFIEQFWLRRDPTPGTVENEFKQEHYRRIAYANDHYTARSGLAGWKTDRGRIYIVYGPPDEIESHPDGGGAHAFPYEQWMYHLIQGIGNNVIVEFDDPNRTGEYHMTADPSAPLASFWSDTVKRGPLNRQVHALGVLRDDGTVTLNVPEPMMKEVAIGQSVSVDTHAGVVRGHVFRIDPSANNITVPVSVTLNAPLPAGRSANSVDATIDVEHVPDTIIVGRPVFASANSDGTLFKIEPDGKHAVRVPVHFGRASINQIEIVSGLMPGDRVILSDMSAYANYDRIELK
jgi:GWxTD domain-containing protein